MHPDEDDVLETQLAILDLGDILELGRKTPHAPQCGAVLTVELVAIAVIEVRAVVLQRARATGVETVASRTHLRGGEHTRDRVGRRVRRCISVVVC